MFDCIIGVKVKSFEKYRKKLELLDKWKPKSEKRTWKLTEMEAIGNILRTWRTTHYLIWLHKNQWLVVEKKNTKFSFASSVRGPLENEGFWKRFTMSSYVL